MVCPTSRERFCLATKSPPPPTHSQVTTHNSQLKSKNRKTIFLKKRFSEKKIPGPTSQSHACRVPLPYLGPSPLVSNILPGCNSSWPPLLTHAHLHRRSRNTLRVCLTSSSSSSSLASEKYVTHLFLSSTNTNFSSHNCISPPPPPFSIITNSN